MAWADRPPEDRAALTYCGPRGIPLSVFLGRVVYPGDPEWLPDDTLAAFDWLERDMRTCVGCGQDTAETVGPEHADKWNAEVAGRCDACVARSRAMHIVIGKDDLDPTAGVRLRAWRDEEDPGGDIVDGT